MLTGEVPVPPFELLTVRSIGHTTNPEVLFVVAIVNAADSARLGVAELLVEAGEPEGLIEGMAEIGRGRSVFAARPEQGDVLLVDLLDGSEVEGLVAGDGAADGESELASREIVFLLLQRGFRAKRVVAEETEDVAMCIVRARLGHDRERAA